MPPLTPAPPGAGARTLLLAAAAAAAIWGVHVALAVSGPGRALFSYDSAQYALAGRHLARTGTLATPYSYVGALRESSGPPYPLLAGHPLLPLLSAPAFRVLGEHAWVTLVPVAIAYVVTVTLSAFLVLSAGGAPILASAVAIAVACSPAVLATATDGLSETPFLAAWTGALVLVTRLRPSSRALLLGACLGLAHLARPVVAPTLPAWLAAAALSAEPGKRWRRGAAVLAGFAPFAASLLLYKWRATGSPFADAGGIMALAQLAPEFGPHDVARLLHPPDTVAWILGHPGALVQKLVHSVPRMVAFTLQLTGWPMGLAFVVWAVRARSDREGPVRVAAGGSLAILILLAAATLPRLRYMLPMLPAVVAFGALELERWGRSARLPSVLPIAIVIALLAWSGPRQTAADWVHRLRGGGPQAPFLERDVRGLGTALAARVPAGTVIASDIAPWVSWYADRPSVNLPMTMADLDELASRHGVRAALISNEWLVTLPGNEVWRAALEGAAIPRGWSSADTFAFGRLRARLLVPAGGAPVQARAER